MAIELTRTSERAEKRTGVDRSVDRRNRAMEKLSHRGALARQLGGRCLRLSAIFVAGSFSELCSVPLPRVPARLAHAVEPSAGGGHSGEHNTKPAGGLIMR
jgi:hypothetical protein